MSIEERVKFLSDVGFKVNLDENGFIKEIINNSTGEQLQPVYDAFGNDFVSADKKDAVLLGRYVTMIHQGGLQITKERYGLKIVDEETKEKIELFYLETLFGDINELGSIRLEMNRKDVETVHPEDGLELVQGAFGVKIKSRDRKLDSIQLENENPQMYLQAIVNCIRQTNYIVSNPKINAKLGLVLTTAQECVNTLVNVKYQNSDRVVEMLEGRKSELKGQMKKIGSEIEQCDIAIAKLNSVGKKM